MDYFISRFNLFTLGSEGVTTSNLQSQIKKHFNYVPGSESLIVCLPGWGGKLHELRHVENSAVRQKTSFLAYEFPRGIFSDQKDLTRELFEIANQIVRSEIKELKTKYNFNKCILVCISLASSYGSLVYKDNMNVDEILLIAPGEDLAHDMWHGCRTQHFRKSYEKQGITEAQLIADWNELASKNNFPFLRTRVSIFLGKNDEVIPYRFSRQLGNIYQQRNLDVVVKVFPLGHYLLISLFLLLPKYFLKLN
ncbi:MAG: hypothetical protein Q7R67_00625 [bacterium]|nr:hypothetical protein [bacterium]